MRNDDREIIGRTPNVLRGWWDGLGGGEGLLCSWIKESERSAAVGV